jgi:hypothetical protein
MRVRREQVRGGDELAGRAIAALRGVMRDEARCSAERVVPVASPSTVVTSAPSQASASVRQA